MSDYRNILIAVDLSDDSARVCEAARSMAAAFGARLTLVTVVEYVPMEPMGEALLPTMDIEEELLESARSRLADLATSTGLTDAPQSVRVGNIKAEVIQQAEEAGADLIVLGSRERHGLAILLNYTEDTVLHAAPCDVLAVRIS